MTIPRVTVHDRKEFREWLRRNHKKEDKVDVVLYKRHTGKSAPGHRQLMEEAICFGWIDTTIHRVDEDTFIRKFSKRTKNSTWSRNTLRYARELIKQGKMAVQGMHFYTLGKAKPTLDHGIPKNPSMPPELARALAKKKKANEAFAFLGYSTKRMLYRWILRAKLPATKKKRIDHILRQASEGRKTFF